MLVTVYLKSKHGVQTEGDHQWPCGPVGQRHLGCANRGDGDVRNDRKDDNAAGKRAEVLSLLLQAVKEMPGCLSYVVAQDSTDENWIWITEVWDSEDSHDASLSLPEVKKTIASARPMIAGFSNQAITTPVGVYGLPTARGTRWPVLAFE